MKITLIIQFIFITTKLTFAQIEVGEWRDHFPYSQAIDLTVAENKIYCATEAAIFYYDKSDYSLSKLSKVNGLSDIGIQCIDYNEYNNILFIGYSDGNIDIIKSGKIINISDIERKLMTGSKSINNVLFIDEFAYISTGFGIIVLDLNKEEIKETYYIGEAGTKIIINEITTDNINLYAATENGIYTASLNEPFLNNYEKWSRISSIPNANSNFNAIAYLNNNIFVNYKSDIEGEDTTYVYNIINKDWTYFDTTEVHNTISLYASNNKIIATGDKLLQIKNDSGELIYQKSTLNLDNTTNMRAAKYDSDDNLWIADFNNGLVQKTGYSTFQSYYPNGPNTRDVVKIDIKDNILWATNGAIDGSWTTLWTTQSKPYSFSNQLWTNTSWRSAGVIDVKIDPTDNKRVFFASWGKGVLEVYNNSLKTIYNETNSSLQTMSAGVRVASIAFDSNNNLWVTNTAVSDPISVKTPEGNWSSFNYENIISTTSYLGEIIVTKNNDKWVILGRGGGIFAFNEHETFDNISDDDLNRFSILDENNTIITNDIYSIAEDHDGVIWIGTNMGIIAYYYPENVFSDENFYAQRIILESEVEGQANYLLKDETVTAIAIDGANRKWIGTAKSGVFLMSEDMSYEMYHFTTENSPLISNNIVTLAMDQSSGEVFFGTDMGIVSFRGTAIEGSENNENVYVFPNPVKSEYKGLITITGLVENSNVKITDINGNLVYEITAEGGQAIWEGKNFSGTKVQTGVYLVFSTNEDGSKTVVSKILFYN